jgi:hypothetical protein
MDWENEREGYINNRPVIAYAPVHKPAVKAPKQQHFLSIRGEESLASLIAAAGGIWAVYVATVDYNSLWRVQIMPPGPIEVVAVGILAWLHAKWRRSSNR